MFKNSLTPNLAGWCCNAEKKHKTLKVMDWEVWCQWSQLQAKLCNVLRHLSHSKTPRPGWSSLVVICPSHLCSWVLTLFSLLRSSCGACHS